MEKYHAGNISFPAKVEVGHSVINLDNIVMESKSNSVMNSCNRLDSCEGPNDGKHTHQTPFCGWVNSLTPRQMDSLAAVCDTLLPSIDIIDTAGTASDDTVSTFYRTSASMAGTPEHVGGFISERLRHPKLLLLHFVLWFLSTWFGTFIFCGRASLSGEFPYFQRLSKVSQSKREEIMLSWSFNSFYLIRLMFKSFKYLVLLMYFTQLDEKNENHSWKAIGYCGPDPDFITQTQDRKTTKRRGHDKAEELQEYPSGPLVKGLINIQQPTEVLAETLRGFGFPVAVHECCRNKTSSLSIPSLTIRCDAVIVGSGSGGGVVAGVLAQSGYKVLLLEKGSYHARGNLSLLEGPAMDKMYLNGGVLPTDDMGTLILAGSNVGGGSTINWSASIRTPKHVMREWSNQYELELFESRLYKEAMDIVCEKMGVQSNICKENLNNAVLRRGCHELGYPVINIPQNSPSDHYCGWCCFGCKDGRKKGTSESWLVDMVNSGNGVVLPGCEALKVLYERKGGKTGKIATGVAFEIENGREKEVCVIKSKVTIVACGALGTPILLKRSGLKNAHIGHHLHLHPVAMAWGYFPNATSDGWLKEEKKSYEGGIMTAMSTAVANFEGSGYGALIQTPALHPGMFSVVMPWLSGFNIKERMCKFSRTAHIFALARDKGSGKISSPSSVSYQMDASDEKNLQRGLEKILRIFAMAGAEEIGTHHCKGKTFNVKKASSHEFERFVKEESTRKLRDLSTPICSAHQMGSCRMGVDPKKSVVNQRGETWEVEGLFVADTSVFPTALGVNPMVTVQTIAYCISQSVLEDLRRKRTFVTET